MIDVESHVVDMVHKRLDADMPGVRVYSSHVRSPSEFPCVMIYESSNGTFEPTRGIDGREHHAEVRYTIEVCTNDAVNKKENAKRISKLIDGTMQGMGFFRASRNYDFGTNESSIFVVLLTYRGLIGESPSGNENDLIVYRR